MACPSTRATATSSDSTASRSCSRERGPRSRHSRRPHRLGLRRVRDRRRDPSRRAYARGGRAARRAPLGDARAAAAGARRAPEAAAAERARDRRRARGPAEPDARRARRVAPLAPRRRGRHVRRRRARQVREPQRAARRTSARRARLAARARRRRRVAARLPRRLPVPRRALRAEARAAGAPPALARRLARDAPQSGERRARDRLRRDRTGVRVPPRRLLDAAALSAAAGRLGARRALGGARARARLEDRRRRRDPDPPRHAPDRRLLPPRRRGRRGAEVPRRAPLRDRRRGAAHARDARALVTASRPMRVAIVAEYYPRAEDPVLGVWAHRQALAAREAGADVRVLVLHRPLPPLAAVKRGDLRAALAALRQPRRAELDGIEVTYVPYLSPPRPWSYAAWGACAAPALRSALARLHARFP